MPDLNQNRVVDARRPPQRPLRLRPTLIEWGAGFADVGVLLPIAIALIALNGLNATVVFVGVGLMYLASGLFFRLPVPVQPLKAMAAIAISTGAGAALLGAAGVAMGLTLLVLSFPKPLQWVTTLFPRPIVRGVQLGVGLMLLLKAVQMVVATGSDVAGLVAGGLVLCGCTVAMMRRWGWIVPLLLAACVAWVAASHGTPVATAPTGLPWAPWADLSPQLLLAAWLTLVIPQLPLTLGNAVMATTRTAHDYFGPRARRVTPRALCRSLGMGNIGIGLLGGMPVCHGSGGMSAHVRLGARDGTATVLFGGILVVTGIYFGSAMVPWLQMIPAAVFGALLVPVGWAHAWLARDVIGSGPDTAVAVAVGVIGVATQNLMLGLVAGWCIIGVMAVVGDRFGNDPSVRQRL